MEQVGASLKLLGAYDLIDAKHSRSFTLSCQQKIGGFAKWPDQRPDVLHTYMSWCGLAFSGEPGPFLSFNSSQFSKVFVQSIRPYVCHKEL